MFEIIFSLVFSFIIFVILQYVISHLELKLFSYLEALICDKYAA